MFNIYNISIINHIKKFYNNCKTVERSELCMCVSTADIRRASRMRAAPHRWRHILVYSRFLVPFRSWLVVLFKTCRDEGKNPRILQESHVSRARYGCFSIRRSTAVTTAFAYSSRLCLSARNTNLN